ncbi:regulatory protein RecX [Clostridiales bacterium oral taxon 876 str. F0540]|nr:regulatory protein RecX [Clostridiales bacterium oral taxon 876 str. F0540]
MEMKNIITKIETQKKNIDRVNIYINHEYAFSCSAELIYIHKLKVNEKVDLDDLKEVIDQDNFMKCKNAALKIVERGYKTEKQVYDKLIQKEYEEAYVEKVIEFLKNYNLINDREYAKLYINDKIKLQGRNKIKYDLIKKGIEEHIIEDMLENSDKHISESAALSIAEKKYRSLSRSENDQKKIYKKLGEFMLRKGYSWGEVKLVLNSILKDEELYE